jgi:uncharacterized membrane protein
MRNKTGFIEFIVSKLITGILVVAPIYLAVLLILKVASSLLKIVEPVAKLLPKWMPGADMLSLLALLILCFFVGLAMNTPAGRATWERMEHALFQRLPGYALFRSLTQQLTGHTEDTTWKPALAEIEEAFVPAFIIEELEDGGFTVFVPSIPTPLAGTVYILTPDRVHPLDVPFTSAIKTVSRWGLGSKDLLASLKKKGDWSGVPKKVRRG